MSGTVFCSLPKSCEKLCRFLYQRTALSNFDTKIAEKLRFINFPMWICPCDLIIYCPYNFPTVVCKKWRRAETEFHQDRRTKFLDTQVVQDHPKLLSCFIRRIGV